MRPARYLLKQNTPGNENIRSETMKLDPQIIETASLLIIAAGIGLPIGAAVSKYLVKKGWWE